MRGLFSRNNLIAVLVVALLFTGLYGLYSLYQNKLKLVIRPKAEQAKTLEPVLSVIGQSVEGRKIEAYTFGTGSTTLAFVGGIHGGYEWNSVLLAYDFMDYLKNNPSSLPANLTVTVIPNANPDGTFKIIGKEGRFSLADVPKDLDSAPGRLNADQVDLNRNFDCKWQPTGTWRSKTVSAGTEAFSEPEAQAIRDFALSKKPSAFIFWHSQSNAVYASECQNGILPTTLTLMKTYSEATGYPAVDSFNSYPVTGDAEGWLASIGIPAITVELKTHEEVEWNKNLLGIKAVFDYYGGKLAK